MTEEVKLFLPPRADLDDALDAGLVALTEAIAKLDPERVAHGMLGGAYGYGANWADQVFMMKPYCWCDGEDCPWCAGDAPNFHHKPSGLKVRWYKWIGRGMEVEGAEGVDIGKVFAECTAALSADRSQE